MTEPGPEQRLKHLGIELPQLPQPAGSYLPVRRYGNVVTTASISAKHGGRLRYLGIVGADLTVAQGQESAYGAMLNCLAVVRQELGSLDRVRQVIRVCGYIASAPGFVDQHLVMNAASDLCNRVFGVAGGHVRASLGIAALPNNCSVGVELTVEAEAPA